MTGDCVGLRVQENSFQHQGILREPFHGLLKACSAVCGGYVARAAEAVRPEKALLRSCRGWPSGKAASDRCVARSHEAKRFKRTHLNGRSRNG